MKLAQFTIKRSDIDRLINNLQHLKKMCDKQDNPRFVAVNLLENKTVKKLLGFIPLTEQMRVIVKVDRGLPITPGPGGIEITKQQAKNLGLRQ